MNLLLINSSSGPDYLADLFVAELIHSERYTIYTNFVGNYLFSNYDDPLSLYGNGYTVFSKLNPSLKSNIIFLTMNELSYLITQKKFDKIIYSSIWRSNLLIDNVTKYYNKDDILVLDGEDHTNVFDICNITTYYKRELIPPFFDTCRPISFTFPSYYEPLNHSVFDFTKTYLIAPCIPGYQTSYIYNSEFSYYQQYASAIFGITTRKGGWDCMRHYEIIKMGCIPYFPDIIDKPISTMVNYPLELQYNANLLFDLCLKSPSSIISKYKDSLTHLKFNFTSWLSKYSSSICYHKLLISDKFI